MTDFTIIASSPWNFAFIYVCWIILTTSKLTSSTSISCPSSCFCSPDLRLVDCSRANLTSVPPNMPSEVLSLRLDHNNLFILTNDSFHNLTQLQSLSLKYCSLKKIMVGTFDKLLKLKYLYLSDNVLSFTTLNSIGLFVSSSSLNYISLNRNNITSIPSNLAFPSLIYLDLSENEIVNITFPQSFSACSNLSIIDLSNNKFTNISNDSFVSLYNSSVRLLKLNGNSLLSVDSLAFKPLLRSLTNLSLDSCSSNMTQTILFTILDQFNSSAKLVELSLQYSGIGNFSQSFFNHPSLVNLNALDLSNNPLQFLPLKSAFNSMKRLRSLYLSNCSLYDSSLPALSNITSNLQQLWLDNNKFSSVDIEFPTSLQMLNLSGNNFNLFPSFSTSTRLQILDLNSNNINSSLFSQSKGLSKLKELHLKNNFLHRISKSFFTNLPSLKFLDLSHQITLLSWIDNFAFSHLSSLRRLSLTGNNISSTLAEPQSMPFVGLRKLETLELSSNQIVGLYDASLTGLSRLKVLDLSNNSLYFWTLHSLKSVSQTLRFIDISSNHISAIYNGSKINSMDVLLNSDSFEQIKLTNNPFNCTCSDMQWFTNWIFKTNGSFAINFTSYKCASPPMWKDKPVSDFNPVHMCASSKNSHYYWEKIETGNEVYEYNSPVIFHSFALRLLMILMLCTGFITVISGIAVTLLVYNRRLKKRYLYQPINGSVYA